MALRWGDLDLREGTCVIRRAAVNVGYRVVETTPKSHKSRTIALDPQTVELLEALPRGIGEAHVFTDEDGKALHPDRVSKVFARLVKKAGLPPTTVHGLRHLSAILDLEAGVDPRIAQDRLGHASLSMTTDTYQDYVAPRFQVAAAEARGKLIYG